jgi:hypothetical protein
LNGLRGWGTGMFYKCALVVISIFMVVAIISLPSVSFGEELVAKQSLRPIFDARLILEETKASKQELKVFKREIEPAAVKFWKQKGKECDEPELEVIDIAKGSFTKASSNQEAILYKYCTTGHNFALDGIAVLENDHVVTHILYEGAWNLAIGALPDINGNGLSEILVSTGGTSTGEIWGVITIIEMSDHGIRKFGCTATYSSNGGRETNANKIRTIARNFGQSPERNLFFIENLSVRKRAADMASG